MLDVLKALDKLKELVMSCEELQEPYNYFAAKLANDNAFHAYNQEEVRDCPELLAILKLTAGRMMGKPVQDLHQIILKVDHSEFYHGAGMAHGKMVTFIYFGDIDMGLVYSGTPSGGESCFARFTVRLRIRVDPPAES
jgi:hypothetical protein